MRTPLTAIQGMTELLAAYDVEPVRRREMNLAINDEVKRLTRMITGYLDITRLESGATDMRLSPVRAESLLERILILLEPVAAQRQIRLVRNFPPDLPPVSRRSRPALARGGESGFERHQVQPRRHQRHDLGARRGGVRRHRGGRPRIRHSRGRSGARIRKVLSRPARAGRRCARHRSRPGAGSRNRRTASRLRLRAERSQPGFHLHPADSPQ